VAAGSERRRGAAVSDFAHGKEGRGGLTGREGSLPHDGAPAAHGQRRQRAAVLGFRRRGR
jgi:hypothetical protein